MAKRVAKTPVADEEILAYDNVPIDVAARYLGISQSSVRLALREDRARQFGFAVQGSGNGLIYHISPGGLVRYKREGGVIVPFESIEELLADVVVKLVDEKMQGIRRIAELSLLQRSGVG